MSPASGHTKIGNPVKPILSDNRLQDWRVFRISNVKHRHKKICFRFSFRLAEAENLR
ncbi:hypothetical protein AM571_PC01802 (plasmid) [Rhizobium etli 8C-3]|uniref:Uncharacterized protein n=1 Tax=Rhizobium etli 8C-3 TaxID=538025 RepID=A0A1L5PHA3_RHIET|nr:hypothetical protein AM571_PC01802 [Rhizobium etli 8C-3]